MGGRGLDWCGSKFGQILGSREHNNEEYGSKYGGKFLAVYGSINFLGTTLLRAATMPHPGVTMTKFWVNEMYVQAK